MDYCYTCRRTLNGALVCPGCGACAPDVDLLPAAPGARADATYPAGHYLPTGPGGFTAAGSAGHALAGHGAPAALAPYLPAPDVPAGFAPAAAPVAGEDLPESELGTTSIAPTLHRGRAARRRQLERWKKNRRRAGVATAFALFGGGVTVASMQSHGSGRGGTAAASPYDTVTPVTLRIDTSAGDPSVLSQQGAHTPGKHAAAVPQQRAGTPSLPSAQATHPVTDNGGTVPISAGGPSSVHTTRTQPAPSTTTAAATGNQDASTGSSAGTDPGSTDSGTDTSAGGTDTGGSTTANPAAGSPTTPPATTSPTTTPAPHQGVCILVLCIG
ncbi:hypothetical protein OG552_32990 [Streptomyces sp. NBC_01476]|uniref:SCO2400 family protein n=1 Tax=Streptomyces sp. NBC_01476 TaxID=2903881 RepID=UPI002E30BD7E|nr:hypothetical protein [Streptomyces sp. NBC_01476]